MNSGHRFPSDFPCGHISTISHNLSVAPDIPEAKNERSSQRKDNMNSDQKNRSTLPDIMGFLDRNPDKLQIEPKAIGRGMYDFLEDDEKKVMESGMAPTIKMERLSEQIREQLGRVLAEHFNSPELAATFAESIDDKYIAEIMRQVLMGMMERAKQAKRSAT